MSIQLSAKVIASAILSGFDDYRDHFRQITNGARTRFEKAQWQEIQQAAAERINLYELKVTQVREQLYATFSVGLLHDMTIWPIVKEAYIELIEERFDDELSETWYNSIFCSLSSHDQISDHNMFVQSTRPTQRVATPKPQTRLYYPKADLHAALSAIFQDYRFDVGYEHLSRDIQHLEAQMRRHLPEWVCKDQELCIELFASRLYRNKGAYLVGRIYTAQEQWPLAIALIHPDGSGIRVDALITDEAEVSIIFSFTRSYFMVRVNYPAEFISFLKRILPGKHSADLYTSIGFYKHGKSEFYRALCHHLNTVDDQFMMAPGVRGMVMSVFTLPGFNTVFKIIKDHFAPSKNIDRATVIEKYRLVKHVDRVGRMADTQEFSDFRFPVSRFEPDCLSELLEVAPTTVALEGDKVLIRHCWTERRMTPLNLYLEQASPAQIEAALDDYGLAIKQLAAANIFPGDMLLKNFGVTRHGRVIFYDYDEISYLTEVHFRDIPEALYPEQELSSEPWYSVGPNDVFPEEFPTFLFAKVEQRRLFNKLHGELFTAAYWQGIQETIRSGKVMDVFPYRRSEMAEQLP